MVDKFYMKPISLEGMSDQTYRQAIYDVMKYYVDDIDMQSKNIHDSRKEVIEKLLKSLQMAPNRSVIEVEARSLMDALKSRGRWWLLGYSFSNNGRFKKLILQVINDWSMLEQLKRKDEHMQHLIAAVTKEKSQMQSDFDGIMRQKETAHQKNIKEIQSQMSRVISEVQSLRQENSQIKEHLLQSLDKDEVTQSLGRV